jgi:hypothetical protein
MAEAIPATKPTTPMTSAIAWCRVTVSRIGFGPRGPAGNHQDPVRTVHLCGGNPGVRQGGKQQRTTMTKDGYDVLYLTDAAGGRSQTVYRTAIERLAVSAHGGH